MGFTIDGVESRHGISYVKVPEDVLQLMADLPTQRQQDTLMGAYVRHFLGVPEGKVPSTVSPAYSVASRIADRIVTGILTGGKRNGNGEPGLADELLEPDEYLPDEYVDGTREVLGK